MISKAISRFAIMSALGTGVSVVVFGIAIFIPKLTMIAYASSIGIALCFVVMVISNDFYTLDNRRIFSRLAHSFSILYCILVVIVYYTQISFVRLGSPSAEALSIVAYAPPKTAYFALDILGYFFMSVSIFFLSFTIYNNRLLKTSLLFVGIWGMTCVVVPLLPFLYQASGCSSDMFGVIVLSLWSILFIPISILLAIYYRKNGTVKNE